MTDSRISGLHRLGMAERLNELERLGWLSADDAQMLRQGRQVLQPAIADRMVENVVGVFGLPFAIAPNFVVNGRDYIVPMVVEEPSVVAAVSNAARLARPGGFTAKCDEWLLAGQIHVTRVADAAGAIDRLAARRGELISAANGARPGLARHGGGVRDIEFQTLTLPDDEVAIVLRVLVATGDAMGANSVNTICEALAPRVAEICDGDVVLRILSNLADRSLVSARVNYRIDSLASDEFTGIDVRDRIVTASEIASVDPYRAATHNKGIMNGIDAVAIATGNDWRALEAGAHAFAALSGRYLPLARWRVAADGSLQGKLEMPLRVAIAGGTLHANNAAMLSLRMTGVETAQQLAELMAAVGLAQNFAAIRALATHGIQAGHMRLHARSSAAAAAVCELHSKPDGRAGGKLILLGEHAVVYGRRAIALPIPDAVTATVAGNAVDSPGFVARILPVIGHALGLADHDPGIEVRSSLPPGMGLGVSAAVAVAVIRAVASSLGLELSDEEVNRVAFRCEKIAHGTPSGIDNSMATFGKPMLFRNRNGLQLDELALDETPPLLIAFSKQQASTREQVAAVRARFEAQPALYGAVFDEMDALCVAGVDALQARDYALLGTLMNLCHGMLNAIGVSTPELESMVHIARAAGAVGAKLTGSGGGGSIVALCPGKLSQVADALSAAGFRTIDLTMKGE